MLKKFNKILSKFTLYVRALTLPAVLASAFMTYSSWVSVDRAVTTEEGRTAVMNMLSQNFSFLNAQYTEGILSNLHDNVSIENHYASGREEKINKEKYKNTLEILRALKYRVKFQTENIQIQPLGEGKFSVHLVALQSFENQLAKALNKTTKLYQTMLVVTKDGEAKIMQITSRTTQA